MVRLPWQKVALDKVVSAIALTLASPLALAIVLAEVANAVLIPADRGWPLYSEVRISAGRPIRLWKFRILRRSAIERVRLGGAVPKLAESEPGNLTRVGRSLKRTGLDELPQLWSVLVGGMTLFGPRPKPVAEYRQGLESGHTHRTVMRAGLSGPAQLLKGTERGPDDEVAADLAYIEMLREATGWRVLAHDLRMLADTARLMLRMTGE